MKNRPKPSDELIWAAAYAAFFTSEARQYAVKQGLGWGKFTSNNEFVDGFAEDAATFADWALEAYKRTNNV